MLVESVAPPVVFAAAHYGALVLLLFVLCGYSELLFRSIVHN